MTTHQILGMAKGDIGIIHGKSAQHDAKEENDAAGNKNAPQGDPAATPRRGICHNGILSRAALNSWGGIDR
jgi:hypothetical protein